MANRFKTALEIQDAGNLRALAREFVAVVDEATNANNGTVGSWNDAAVILFVNKFESLVRSEAPGRFGAAYDFCNKNLDLSDSAGLNGKIDQADTGFYYDSSYKS